MDDSRVATSPVMEHIGTVLTHVMLRVSWCRFWISRINGIVIVDCADILRGVNVIRIVNWGDAEIIDICVMAMDDLRYDHKLDGRYPS